MLRQTHTFATLAVSPGTFGEVEHLLRAAGYGHAFVDGAIDMSGIGLVIDQTQVAVVLAEERATS